MPFARLLVPFAATALIFCLAPSGYPQQQESGDAQKTSVEVDGSDLSRELAEREEKISQLSSEEREKLGAAHAKAAEDPAVKAALAKREQAMREFFDAVHVSILKNDPSLAPVLGDFSQNPPGEAVP